MEGQGRSSKVKEGYGWSFPITGLTFQGRKVTGGVCSRLCWYVQSASHWLANKRASKNPT